MKTICMNAAAGLITGIAVLAFSSCTDSKSNTPSARQEAETKASTTGEAVSEAKDACDVLTVSDVKEILAFKIDEDYKPERSGNYDAGSFKQRNCYYSEASKYIPDPLKRKRIGVSIEYYSTPAAAISQLHIAIKNRRTKPTQGSHVTANPNPVNLFPAAGDSAYYQIGDDFTQFGNRDSYGTFGFASKGRFVMIHWAQIPSQEIIAKLGDLYTIINNH
jgi:hypothetical protein